MGMGSSALVSIMEDLAHEVEVNLGGGHRIYTRQIQSMDRRGGGGFSITIETPERVVIEDRIRIDAMRTEHFERELVEATVRTVRKMTRAVCKERGHTDEEYITHVRLKEMSEGERKRGQEEAKQKRLRDEQAFQIREQKAAQAALAMSFDDEQPTGEKVDGDP